MRTDCHPYVLHSATYCRPDKVHLGFKKIKNKNYNNEIIKTIQI